MSSIYHNIIKIEPEGVEAPFAALIIMRENLTMTKSRNIKFVSKEQEIELVNEIRKVFHYDPETGILTRKYCHHKSKKWNSRWSGKIAGDSPSSFHLKVVVLSGRHPITHVIWAWMTGEFPRSIIDHIDMNFNNNKWSNLRFANKSLNMMNRGLQKNNKSGCKGVGFDKIRNKWAAYVTANGRRFYLGRFDSKEDAIAARLAAAAEKHGQFCREVVKSC